MMRRNSAMERASKENLANVNNNDNASPQASSTLQTSKSMDSSVIPLPRSQENNPIKKFRHNMAAGAAATTLITTTTVTTTAPLPPPPVSRRTRLVFTFFFLFDNLALKTLIIYFHYFSTNTSPSFSPGETTPKLPPKPKNTNFSVHNGNSNSTLVQYQNEEIIF